MPKEEQTLEAEIVAKGKTAPRLTPADIDECIVSEHYFTAFDGAIAAMAALDVDPRQAMRLPVALHVLTFCVLVLRNGFTVTGESACASPKNFDAEIGRKIAKTNAREKIWLLEGYLLRERLAAQR